MMTEVRGQKTASGDCGFQIADSGILIATDPHRPTQMTYKKYPQITQIIKISCLKFAPLWNPPKG
jgi:hypothetical protein